MVYMREDTARRSNTRVEGADNPLQDLPDDERRRLLDLKATSRVLGGTTEPVIRKLVRQKQLVMVKIGRRSFITMQSIDAYTDRLVAAAEAQSEDAGVAA